LVYLATTLVVLPSTVLVLATRAERLRDMVSMLSRLRRMLAAVRELWRHIVSNRAASECAGSIQCFLVSFVSTVHVEA
jgi:hypothetical protein